MFKPLNSKRFNSPTLPFAPGPAPFLDWIAVERLVVDTEYQREIGRRGAINVMQIAENFDWSKFAPVIVAPVEGGNFAIVDGQHRTTAAMLRDIDFERGQSGNPKGRPTINPNLRGFLAQMMDEDVPVQASCWKSNWPRQVCHMVLTKAVSGGTSGSRPNRSQCIRSESLPRKFGYRKIAIRDSLGKFGRRAARSEISAYRDRQSSR